MSFCLLFLCAYKAWTTCVACKRLAYWAGPGTICIGSKAPGIIPTPTSVCHHLQASIHLPKNWPLLLFEIFQPTNQSWSYLNSDFCWGPFWISSTHIYLVKKAHDPQRSSLDEDLSQSLLLAEVLFGVFVSALSITISLLQWGCTGKRSGCLKIGWTAAVQIERRYWPHGCRWICAGKAWC